MGATVTVVEGASHVVMLSRPGRRRRRSAGGRPELFARLTTGPQLTTGE
jgi:hypothetical protein